MRLTILTPGLWQHVTCPVQFSLVVDDFGVKYKYVGEENAQHLINAIQTEGYKLSIDWSGTKYCRITLQWDWEILTLTISMPGYVQKMLVRFKHEPPPRDQYSRYQTQLKKYGKMRMTQFLSTIHRSWTKNARKWSNTYCILQNRL